MNYWKYCGISQYKNKTPGQQMEIFFNEYNRNRLNELYKRFFSGVELPYSFNEMIEIGYVFEMLETCMVTIKGNKAISCSHRIKDEIFKKGTQDFKDFESILFTFIEGFVPAIGVVGSIKYLNSAGLRGSIAGKLLIDNLTKIVIRNSDCVFEPEVFFRHDNKNNHPGNFKREKKNHLYKKKGKF